MAVLSELNRRRWRSFNTAVAALELRLSREELLSLPQYMGLCPTGQCNAQCGFCSVTLNRTGILKKQLPLEKLREMIAPLSRTVRMYGVEGNGEPTLHDRFYEITSCTTCPCTSVSRMSRLEKRTVSRV